VDLNDALKKKLGGEILCSAVWYSFTIFMYFISLNTLQQQTAFQGSL
jgi:hypothetical protein